MAGGRHALAVEPYEPRRRECGGIGPRAHHARVPQPFVDALAVQFLRRCVSRRLFAALFKLLFERGKLGERGIGIRLLVAPAANGCRKALRNTVHARPDRHARRVRAAVGRARAA